MNTFPPISEKRASCAVGGMTPASKRSSCGSDPFLPVCPVGGAYVVVEDAAVNRCRATANRIRGSYQEKDSLLDMLQRVRAQFLRGRPDTESSGQLPLVSPPTLPSRLRPEQPQTRGFSRGIRLLQILRRGETLATEPASSAQQACDASAAEEDSVSSFPLKGLRRLSVASTVPPSHASASTTAAVASSRRASADAHSLLREAEEAAVEREGRGQAAMLHPRYFPSPPPSVDSAMTAALQLGVGGVDEEAERMVVPLHELSSLPEQLTHLRDLETCSRQRVAVAEAWDRQVVCEMMMVHYVTFVLKPEMEELLAAERVARGTVRYDEERQRYELCQASELAALVREGVRAIRAKEMKLARLEQVEAQVSRPRPRAGTSAEEERSGSEDARDILRRYVQMRHGKALHDAVGDEDAAASSDEGPLMALPPVGRSVVPTETSHTIWQAAAVARDWPTVSVIAASPEKTQRPRQRRQSTADALAARRGSGLVLPPVFGVAGRAMPRRNTLGVANYMSLLDGDSQRRAVIAQAEAELREDIVALSRSEWSALRGWQHKKLHLERLLYWRGAREQREREELAALTDVGSVGAAAEARAARSALEAVVGEVTLAEENARYVILNEERDAVADLDAAAQRLALALSADTLLHQHHVAAAAAFAELLRFQSELTTGQPPRGTEALQRRAVEAEWEAWVVQVASPRAAVLPMLNDVCHNDSAYAAVRVLQRAFRSSLRGRLGWRQTHHLISNDVQRLRGAKAVRQGRHQLSELQIAVERERAALEAEILAEHAAARAAFCDREFQHRLAIMSQEGLTYSSYQRGFLDELLANIIQPRIERCLHDEASARLHTTVEEELRREQAVSRFARGASLVEAKEALRAQESADRERIVHTETDALTQLWHARQDSLEDIRLAARDRVLKCIQERKALAAAAEESVAELADTLAQSHRELVQGARRELAETEVSAMDLAWRTALAEEEAVAREGLRADCERAGAVIREAEHHTSAQRNSIARRADEVAAAEAAARSSTCEEEDAAWQQMTGVAFFSTPNGEQIRTYSQQRHAVAVLSDAYIATRDGALGRTATLRHLHEAFRVRRELGELRAIRARQRAQVRAAERQLSQQLEEERADTREACQFLLDVLSSRSEPRERADLETTEAFLRDLLIHNYFQHTEGNAAATDAEPSFAQRIDRELLARVEARERGAIVESWAEVFDRYFEKERANAVADVQARAIQRAWRRCLRRRADKERRQDGGLRALCIQEAVERMGIELTEQSTVAIDVVLPALAAEARLRVAQEVLLVVLEQRCVTVDRAVVEAQELEQRLALLWDMRYSLCDDVLCADEARARRQLLATVHAPGLEQARLRSEEVLQRELLYRERGYYLLRVLAKEEAAVRQFIWEREYTSDVQALAASLALVPPPSSLSESKWGDEL